MFNNGLKKELKREINKLQQMVYELIGYHKKCHYCGKIGHKEEMILEKLGEYSSCYHYYHPECYAKKFNKHLCECGCGKWVDNKTTKKEE